METRSSLPKINIKATGENIKWLREKSDISVNALAEMLDIHFVAVYSWQKGRALPSVYNLVALSKIFGASMEEILVVE